MNPLAPLVRIKLLHIYNTKLMIYFLLSFRISVGPVLSLWYNLQITYWGLHPPDILLVVFAIGPDKPSSPHPGSTSEWDGCKCYILLLFYIAVLDCAFLLLSAKDRFHYNCFIISNNNFLLTAATNPPQSHLGRVRCYPSRQRLDLPASCVTSCAVPTADESSHSATGTLH